jgi:hypothetical protein
MGAKDASKVYGCLPGAVEHEIYCEEGPGVVSSGHVDDVHVYGGIGVETGPTVGYCYLQGGKVGPEGSDE